MDLKYGTGYIEHMGAISVEKALEIIERIDCETGAELVPVQSCCGRAAGDELRARGDQPPFDRACLDGFAFRSCDVRGASREAPAVLRQVGSLRAGDAAVFSVGKGECARIMTGAAMPAGADAIAGIEDAAYEGFSDAGAFRAEGADMPEVLIFRDPWPRSNVAARGEDFSAGQTICKRGQRIDAAAAGCLAAAGYASVPVLRRPPVAVLATGSELAAPGSPLGPGSIYDSNSVYIASRLRELGFEAETFRCGDDEESIGKLLLELANSGRIILTLGGVSVGDADMLPKILAGFASEADPGCEVLIKGVALKPGSPLMLARLGGSHVLCLSGNPYAAAATFELFARPLLGRLCGEDMRMKEDTGTLAEEFARGSAVPRFIRANIDEGRVSFPSSHSSGQLLSMSGCNCLARIPAGSGPFPAGTEVGVFRI